jgi:hypothetical protein
MKTTRTLALLLCLALLGVFAPTVASAATATVKGTYYPLTAARLLDTRTSTGGHPTPLGPTASLVLDVAGRGGVPTSGASAVVINVTVTGATAGSYVTAWPGGTRPGVSSINFVKGATRANIATVPLSASGDLSLYNNSGSVNVIVDVLGFYGSGDTAPTDPGTANEFTSVTPERLFDSRQTTEGPLKGGETNTFFVDFGVGGSLSSSVHALALNITAVAGQGAGYLTTWDGGATRPTASTLNYTGAAATANMAVVKTKLCTTTACGTPAPVQFAVYNGSGGSVDVLVDLVGIYYNDGTAGLRFTPLVPKRITDSRSKLNGVPLTQGQTQALTAPSTVVSADTDSLVTNTTAVAPTASTYLSLWRVGESRPPVSNLNALAGTTVANGAVIPLSATNKFNIYNNAGTTNFLVDVTGRFDGSVSLAGLRAAKKSDYGQVSSRSVRR